MIQQFLVQHSNVLLNAHF